MDVFIGEELELLLKKLVHCQDPKTGSQEFVGVVRADVRKDGVYLLVEETGWSTGDSGIVIETKYLK